MSIGMWYWVILILWILLSGASWYWNDPRISRVGNLVLIVLLILNGLMDVGSPIK
jgi:threonine/homoserine/homoserine lactone efflux protein